MILKNKLDTSDNESEPKDIFDRIMSFRGLNRFYEIYAKYKSVLLYIFFGGLTTVISIASFAVCDFVFNINELIANVISWICAVTFACVTNRIWVFRSRTKGKEIITEVISFFSGRLLTLGVEQVIVLVFITILHFNPFIVKVTAQFAVLILNYFISKLIVFKKIRS